MIVFGHTHVSFTSLIKQDTKNFSGTTFSINLRKVSPETETETKTKSFEYILRISGQVHNY